MGVSSQFLSALADIDEAKDCHKLVTFNIEEEELLREHHNKLLKQEEHEMNCFDDDCKQCNDCDCDEESQSLCVTHAGYTPAGCL